MKLQTGQKVTTPRLVGDALLTVTHDTMISNPQATLPQLFSHEEQVIAVAGGGMQTNARHAQKQKFFHFLHRGIHLRLQRIVLGSKLEMEPNKKNRGQTEFTGAKPKTGGC